MATVSVIDFKNEIEFLMRAHKGMDIYQAFAEWLACNANAKSVMVAATTFSCYVYFPQGGSVRISDHSKYGSNDVTHIRIGGSWGRSLDRLRQATIAARNGFHSYKQLHDLVSKYRRIGPDGYYVPESKILSELAGF